MSLIGTVSANTRQEIRVEKPIHAILIKASYENADAITAIAGKPQGVLDLLESSNIQFSVKIQAKDGTIRRLYTLLPLLPIVELHTAEDNHIAAAITGNRLDVSMYLPFSNVGAIPFNDSETMIIEFEASVFSMSVYSLDHKLVAETYNKIEAVTITSGLREKEFDVNGMSTAIIRRSDLTASTKVTVRYTNGKILEYTPDELDMMGLLSNEICLNLDGKVKSGFGKYIVLDVSEISTILFTRSSTTQFEFYFVKEDVHEEVQKASIINSRLKDTTHVRKMNFIQKRINA